MFNDSYMEWLWRPSDSFAIGFCGLDKAQRSIAFLEFWCGSWCSYRPMNQQIDNIHSFIFCKDFAPSMKLPLVNKLADFFLNLVLNVLLLFFDSCIIIIIIIIIVVIVIVIIITIFFYSYRNLSLTAVATSCMQTWATYPPTKTGRFTEHALPQFTLTSIIRLRERWRPDLNQGYQQCETKSILS